MRKDALVMVCASMGALAWLIGLPPQTGAG
jgi:hypothetical protein